MPLSSTQKTATACVPVVLVAVASSRTPGYAPLPELEREHRQLQDIYEEAEGAGHCEPVNRFPVAAGDIFDIFRTSRYARRIQVLHFAGHSDSDALLMLDKAGRGQLVGAAGLADFLSAQPAPHLVFLNGCYTEAQIQGLHAAGVRAVIAAREKIDDGPACDFAVHFHKGLASGQSITDAYNAAHGAMGALTYGAGPPWDRDAWRLSAPNGAGAWKLHCAYDNNSGNADLQQVGAELRQLAPPSVSLLPVLTPTDSFQTEGEMQADIYDPWQPLLPDPDRYRFYQSLAQANAFDERIRSALPRSKQQGYYQARNANEINRVLGRLGDDSESYGLYWIRGGEHDPADTIQQISESVWLIGWIECDIKDLWVYRHHRSFRQYVVLHLKAMNPFF